jgi:hypothetical protein
VIARSTARLPHNKRLVPIAARARTRQPAAAAPAQAWRCGASGGHALPLLGSIAIVLIWNVVGARFHSNRNSRFRPVGS